MLQRIRDRSHGWVAKTIVGFIVVTFAFFGVESIIGAFTGSSDEVATVNGDKISRQSVETEVQRAIRSGQVAPEQEREARTQIINQMIDSRLLDQYAEEGGLHLSDAQLDQLIVSLPEFQDDKGRFDADVFRNRLASAGYSPTSFRQQLSSDTLREQLRQGFASSAFVLPSETEALSKLQRQTRSFRYATLSSADLETPVTLSDDELTAWYDGHQENYRRPAQVKLAYVLLDQTELAEGGEVTDETLQAEYAAKRAEAPREIAHIMVEKGDDVAASRSKLEAAREQLAAGEDFAKVAESVSEDSSTADKGGELGVITRGIFGEEFDDAAFALDEGQVSDIVDTGDSLHLIKVTGLDIASFDDMRDELLTDARQSASRDAFNEKAQQLKDESFAADDLKSVAKDLDLPLQQTDWVAQDTDDALLSEPGVMSAAFDDEVLKEGYNSDVIELDDSRRLVLRVAEQRPATTLAFDEVKQQVQREATADKTTNALKALAESDLKTLSDGQQVDGIDWREAKDVSRQADSQLPQSLVKQAFALAHPQGGKSVYGHAVLKNGIALIELTDVGESEPGEMDQFLSRLASRLQAQAAVQGLQESLRERADIERK
ncbi:SurA N-terminal domain-containing protein [Cobetia crustatorum]|uniref:SurA N-terminal domain-containing protein n=1 Tax=Cobetia crustatorum TaxID=553385 RepID=UPI00046A5E2B|nr:SurA N-terminal domain-containing protein [Cobetia crustatorum]